MVGGEIQLYYVLGYIVVDDIIFSMVEQFMNFIYFVVLVLVLILGLSGVGGIDIVVYQMFYVGLDGWMLLELLVDQLFFGNFVMQIGFDYCISGGIE